MEKFEVPQFNHNAENLETGLGLTDKESHYVRNAVLFECLACPIMIGEFYNDPSEAPNNLKTMGGIYERTVSHMRNGMEQFYLTFIFKEGYHSISDAVQKSADLIEDYKRSEEVEKIEKLLKSLIISITGSPLYSIGEAIKLIHSCSFNFDSFTEFMIKDEDYDLSGKYCPTVQEITETTLEEVNDALKIMLEKAQKEKEEKQKNEDKEKKSGKKKKSEDS